MNSRRAKPKQVIPTMLVPAVTCEMDKKNRAPAKESEFRANKHGGLKQPAIGKGPQGRCIDSLIEFACCG